MDNDPDIPQSGAELLADWRGAKRDLAAATTAAEVATLALEAAQAADGAASETEAAALAAADRVEQALRAASSAKRAAAHAARAAQILVASAEGDKALAQHDVEETQEAKKRQANGSTRLNSAVFLETRPKAIREGPIFVSS